MPLLALSVTHEMSCQTTLQRKETFDVRVGRLPVTDGHTQTHGHTDARTII